jgi:hypothetical protein
VVDVCGGIRIWAVVEVNASEGMVRSGVFVFKDAFRAIRVLALYDDEFPII